MPDRLTRRELQELIRRVFQPTADDRAIAVLADLPDGEKPDLPAWRERRQLAFEWTEALAASADALGLEARLFLYRNVRTNNAELPAAAWRFQGGALPADADALDPASAEPFERIFARHDILLAPTELSTTAPLKLAARRHGFRAATLPGFTSAMVPALKLDYVEIDRRVHRLKTLLDRARGADVRFETDDGPAHLYLDLRHRTAHASGGLVTEPGTAGNLPSGETYIVPYEGEQAGDPSRSRGLLPVELAGEVVHYRIEENRAVAVESDGPLSRREVELLKREPGYANLAELGLGVLADFGVQPVGVILLDEKLGLHIAFGRSDHFGGQVGPDQFSSPSAVVHIDRVFLPETQPKVRVPAVDLVTEGGEVQPLIRDHRFLASIWER